MKKISCCKHEVVQFIIATGTGTDVMMIMMSFAVANIGLEFVICIFDISKGRRCYECTAAFFMMN